MIEPGRSPHLYLYVLDTMADWEAGYIVSELGSGRFFIKPEQRYTLSLCGLSKEPVTTMGGLRLIPEMILDEIEPQAGDVLLLPGGDTWLTPVHQPVFPVVTRFLENGLVVGAICGATMGLAQAGFLNERPHTCNDLEVLKMFCPGYSGGEWYVPEPAVTDGNLVTASGLAAVDFAYHIMKILNVMREETLEAWYQLHRTRKPEWFFALERSLGTPVDPSG